MMNMRRERSANLRDHAKHRFVSFLQVVILFSFFIIPLAVAQAVPQAPLSSDSGKTLAGSGSPATSEVEGRLSLMQSQLDELKKDNADTFKTVLTGSSFLISAVAVIVTILSVFLFTSAKSSLKDMKADIRNDLEDSRKSSAERKAEIRTYIEDFRETEKSLREGLQDAKREVEATDSKIKELTAAAEVKIDGLNRSARDGILDAMNVMVDFLRESFPDTAKNDNLEVVRCKLFFRLGDDKEQTRSLQYLGFVGGPDDAKFCDQVSSDARYSTDIRFAAAKAAEFIRKRIESTIHHSEPDQTSG